MRGPRYKYKLGYSIVQGTKKYNETERKTSNTKGEIINSLNKNYENNI